MRDNFAVWAMKIDGSGQHKLFGKAGFDFFQPRWSPDGTKLVVTRCDSTVGFVTNCDIVLTKRDGSGARTLVGGNRFSGNATFSPDGKWIAFDSDRAGYISTVWVLRLDGGSADPTDRTRSRSLLAELVARRNAPRDQQQLLSRAQPGLHHAQDGSQLRQLTHATGGGGPAFASYSPDGQQIVFSSDQLRGPDFDRLDLFVMKTDGTHVRRIVDDQPNAVGGDWSRGEE